jgi:aquaporin Z
MNDNRALAAEAFGTFMLVASVLGAAFYSFGAPAGAAGILGVALSIGCTVMVVIFALGHLSGGHYNPAVTIGLVVGGRFEMARAIPYIIAQVVGACAACGIFSLVGHTGASFAANGYGDLSMLKATLVQVFILEVVLTAFFVIVIMGVTRAEGPSLLAPLAIGLALTAIHILAIPISNASVNPARSLATALYAGGEALRQVWLFWVAPLIGAAIGGLFAKWLLNE